MARLMIRERCSGRHLRKVVQFSIYYVIAFLALLASADDDTCPVFYIGDSTDERVDEEADGRCPVKYGWHGHGAYLLVCKSWSLSEASRAEAQVVRYFVEHQYIWNIKQGGPAVKGISVIRKDFQGCFCVYACFARRGGRVPTCRGPVNRTLDEQRDTRRRHHRNPNRCNRLPQLYQAPWPADAAGEHGTSSFQCLEKHTLSIPVFAPHTRGALTLFFHLQIRRLASLRLSWLS
jgi:hypothetical protein